MKLQPLRFIVLNLWMFFKHLYIYTNMAKFYTTIEVINEKYIGIVYDANSNNIVYKTEPYISQLETVRQVDKFLATGIEPPKDASTPTNQTVITNTYVPVSKPRRSCCGR